MAFKFQLSSTSKVSVLRLASRLFRIYLLLIYRDIRPSYQPLLLLHEETKEQEEWALRAELEYGNKAGECKADYDDGMPKQTVYNLILLAATSTTRQRR